MSDEEIESKEIEHNFREGQESKIAEDEESDSEDQLSSVPLCDSCSQNFEVLEAIQNLIEKKSLEKPVRPKPKLQEE